MRVCVNATGCVRVLFKSPQSFSPSSIDNLGMPSLSSDKLSVQLGVYDRETSVSTSVSSTCTLVEFVLAPPPKKIILFPTKLAV